MRDFRSKFLFAALSGVLLTGTALAASVSDPWVTGAPANKNWSDDSVVITPDRWIDVPAESQDRALALLASKAVVPLEPGLFLDLLPGRGYPADPDKKPYLVRGVALNEETGGFQIEQRGPELLVVFAAARDDSAPKHRALIVMLPNPALREFVQTVTVE